MIDKIINPVFTILGVVIILLAFMKIGEILLVPKHDYKIELNNNGSVRIMSEYIDTTIVDFNHLEEFIEQDNL